MEYKNRSYTFLILVIVIIGTLLRFYDFPSWSFSNDELSALQRTQFGSFAELINKGVIVDGHPPATQVFIYYWIKLFGASEFALRTPFAIFSVISIYLSYLLGRSWFNRGTGLLLSGTMAVLYFPLVYGVIARPYSLGLMTCIGSAYLWNENRKEIVPWFKRFGFILLASISIQTHYFAALLIGLLLLYGVMTAPKKQTLRNLSNLFYIFLLCTPTIPIFLKQFSKKGLSWLAPPNIDFIFDHLFLINNKSLLFIFVLILFLILGLISKKNQINKKNLFLCLYLTIFHFSIGFLYSIYVQPVLQSSVLLFSLPFYFLGIFCCFPQSKLKIILALALIITLSITSNLFHNNYHVINHFGTFKELVKKNKEWGIKIGRENITYVEHINNPFYFEFYKKQFKDNSHPVISKIENQQDLLTLKETIKSIETDYVVFSWSSVATNPEIYDIIMDKFSVIEDQETFFNSQTTLFKKGASRNALHNSTYEAELNQLKNWTVNNTCQDTLYLFKGEKSEKLDSTNQFSSTFNIQLAKLNTAADKMYISCSAMGYFTTECKATLVIEYFNEQEQKEWYGVDIENYVTTPYKWSKIYASRAIPKNCVLSDLVKVYIWNRGKNEFYFDNLEVNFYSRENILF